MDMTNWGYSVDYNSLNTNLISITSDDENNQLYEQLSDLGIDSVWIGLEWSGKFQNDKCIDRYNELYSYKCLTQP